METMDPEPFRQFLENKFEEQSQMLRILTNQVEGLQMAAKVAWSQPASARMGPQVEKPGAGRQPRPPLLNSETDSLSEKPSAASPTYAPPADPGLSPTSENSKMWEVAEEVENPRKSAARSSVQSRHSEEDHPKHWDELMRESFQGHRQNAKTAMSRTGGGRFEMRSLSFESSSSITKARKTLNTFVNSHVFNYSVFVLILLNLVMLGLEIDQSASLPPGESPPFFAEINLVIVAVFTTEVVLKWVAYGCRGYFMGIEKMWNWFDLIVVALSLFEVVVELLSAVLFAQMDANQLRVMRLARLARTLRGVRVVKLLKYIGSLRTIIFSIVSTMGSLMWTLVLLLMLFYCFGVIIAQSVVDHCRGGGVCTPEIVYYWSGVRNCMLTLFLAITGGISWNDALDPLWKVSTVAVVSLCLYIVITIFAVLNVVTGVFCNTAIESAAADKDIAIMKQMHKHEAQVQSLREIFAEIDTDCSNMITLAELKDALRGHKLKNFMESMNISTQDVWTLFMVVDADASGEISLDEFVFGCQQLQGPAKGLQVARMSYENTVMRQELRKIRDDVTRFNSVVLPPPVGRPSLISPAEDMEEKSSG